VKARRPPRSQATSRGRRWLSRLPTILAGAGLAFLAYQAAHEAIRGGVLTPGGASSEPAGSIASDDVCALTELGLDAGESPPACWRPYSSDSPFNRLLPDDRPADPNSEAIVDRVVGFGPMQNLVAGYHDTPKDYSAPLYYSSRSDPIYRVQCTRYSGRCEIEGMELRIPAAARPAAGGDGHLTVIDEQARWEYDFYDVSEKPDTGGTITVGWGGRTLVGGPGADGLGSGATAAHFGRAAGTIRAQELEAGEIDHALFMVVRCTSGASAWPAAAGTTGTVCRETEDAPALGQHFYLDMSEAALDQLKVAKWKRTILDAAANYGMYVGDTGGGTWGIQIESDSSYTSFGEQPRWFEFARARKDAGFARYYDDEIDRTLYVANLREVDWGSALRVASPCHAMRTC